MINVSEEIQAILSKKPEDVTTADKATILRAMGEMDGQGHALRLEFAQTRGALLLPILQEESFIEKIFEPFDNSNGEPVPFPIRSRKVRSGWYSTGQDSVPMRTAEQKEVFFNTFWINGGVRWQLDYLKAGNATLVDNLMQDMISDIAYKVNYQGMATIKWAEALGDIAVLATVTTAPNSGASLSLDVIKEIMTFMETRTQGRNSVTDIFLSTNQYNELVKLANFASAGASTEVSLPEAERQKILDGGFSGVSSIWLSNFGVRLHKVRRTEFITDNKCYAFDVKKFGVMPVDKRLETMADNAAANRFETGIIGRQRQGFGITDVEACVVYDFSNGTPNAGDTIIANAPSTPAFEV